MVSKALDELMALSQGYGASMTLFTAVELGLFDLLSQGAMSPDEAAERLSTDLRATALFLEALRSLGLLTKRNGSYCNAPMSQKFLVKEKNPYLGHLIRHQGSLSPYWASLGETLRTGQPEALRLVQKGLSKRREEFLLAMDARASIVAPQLARAVDLSPCSSLLDMGCGPGTFSLILAEAYPHLRLTLLDLKEVLKMAKRKIKEAGLNSRVHCHEADFTLENIGYEQYDAVLISNILHMYGPEENRSLLQKANKALVKGGILLINDSFLRNGTKAPRGVALFSLMMLMGTHGGQCYRLDEVKNWLRETGFFRTRQFPLPLFMTLIEARKKER